MSYEAQYSGYCGCCGEPYSKGTPIVKVDDFYWWIAEHARLNKVEESKKPCDKCFLVHAGECF